MRPLRVAALLSLPLAVGAAIVLLALPRQMNQLTERWSHRASMGRALTTASLVAADLDFDDHVHAAATLATLSAQGDVLGAVLRRKDGTVFADWASHGPTTAAREVTVPVESPGAAGGSLTMRFSTAALDAQAAHNRRLAWSIAIAVLVLGAVGSLGLTILLRRGTRAQVARELEAGFDLLVEHLPDGVLIHRGGRVSYVNARARALLAIVGPARGLAVADLAAPRLDELDAAAGVTTVRTVGRALRLEIERRPITFGRTPQELIVLRDVGERERLRDRLEVTQRLASVGSLAAGVAHEINNPLTVILANLEMLELQVEADPEAREMVAEAVDATDRVRRIVGDMRRLSRGDEHDQPGPFAIAPAVQRAVSLTAAEVRQRARVVVVDEGLGQMALGSEARLVQVMVNVLINAAHAMPIGAATRHTIRVAASLRDGKVELAITDDGCGMTADVLARVFDPFFTTKEVGVGTGLGLPICHSLMQAMHGAILLASEPGLGTTVTLQLPAAAVDAGTRAAAAVRRRMTRPPSVTGEAGGPARILVIDDEPGVRASVEKMLGDYAVTTVASGSAALENVTRGQRFDLIVCDVLMPEMAGPQVRTSLERCAPDQARRLVYMTGGVDHRVEDLGDVPAPLRKPFSQAELARFVATNVARLAA